VDPFADLFEEDDQPTYPLADTAAFPTADPIGAQTPKRRPAKKKKSRPALPGKRLKREIESGFFDDGSRLNPKRQRRAAPAPRQTAVHQTRTSRANPVDLTRDDPPKPKVVIDLEAGEDSGRSGDQSSQGSSAVRDTVEVAD
jgi:hypothetical protein